MEKTAVDYLIEQLEFALPDIEWSKYRNETNKALKMEKQQIIDAFEGFPLNTRNSQNGQEYYNQTFNK